MSTTARQVDIRIGAVKRLTKEMKSRIIDVETEKQRTQKFIDAGEDQWTVGKQVTPIVPNLQQPMAPYSPQSC